MSVPAWRTRVVTVPNVITAVRLACVPWFLVLLAQDRVVAAGYLLAVLGCTDWVDGYIARHFDQGSELGKILDPVADRIMLLTAAVALLAYGIVPIWLGVLVLFREALVAGVGLALGALGARRIDVTWSGKAGALSFMCGLPLFMWASATSGTAHDIYIFGAWWFALWGLAFSWYATAQYVPLARAALHEGRKARAGGLA
ncbi:MAG: phosphatidylglycerophosphate synthase [Actinomycetia bacterium]|nr:phosphatidylglycerophosphate synthase [Actinomycetes bacterium]